MKYVHDIDIRSYISVISEEKDPGKVPDKEVWQVLHDQASEGWEFDWECWQSSACFSDGHPIWDYGITEEPKPLPCNEILHNGLVYLVCQEPTGTEHSHDLSGKTKIRTRPLREGEKVQLLAAEAPRVGANLFVQE